MKRPALVPLVFVLAACTSTNASRVRSFERDADEIRNALQIPGLSAAILENQKILWTRGFGWADAREQGAHPLQMTESVPGHNVIENPELARRYAPVLARFARPYALYGNGEIVAATCPSKDVGASVGLLSTVRDLARYDAAIDRHVLLQQKTQELAWTPFVSNAGKPLPYGLGWFVEDYRGERLVWHSGNWGSGFSALYVKVPARNLSMILLANSEALSDPFWVPGETNPFLCSFLRHFVFNGDDPCKEAGEAAINKWLEDRAARAEPAVTVDEAVLASYAGEYQLSEERIITITREGPHIFIDIPRKGDRLELFASPKGDFFFKVTTATRVRFVREGATVTALEFHFGADEAPVQAKRIR